MTLDAVNLVLIFKGIPRDIMIITPLLQDHHLKAEALMIAVALYACACVSGMGALLVIHPFGQFLMTVKTFAVREAATQFMTLGAVIDTLVFCVRRCQLPRAD